VRTAKNQVQYRVDHDRTVPPKRATSSPYFDRRRSLRKAFFVWHFTLEARAST
jgi:hypothetical protein